MEWIRIAAVTVAVLLLGIKDTYAQQHYKGGSALELNYGTNIFGNADNFVNLSYSRYINRKSYWKIGANYFEKTYEYSITLPESETTPTRETKAKDIYIDGNYHYTLASNLKSVYWGLNIGAFTGVEHKKHSDKEYQFIIGPKVGTEMEVFILPRMALLASVQQYWNPFSFHEWNTVWNIGIKALLY